ncbi:Kunitz trypsin inhibitor [Thalictrum thalictroides]|uniref:Kunitz trypsin inhibitor n=1 Tax=Thalictrum thalictroides TaxID=46969 RepID=A0A7J6X7H9_THATH|nr:Kunitz trypsin inhibitor [Thalictrum thalictroides]
MNLLISTVLVFFILLVPLAFTVNAATGTTVLDLDGKKLQSNTNYYILPVIRGRGGGLALAQRNKSCPYYVAQEDSEVSNGLPLKFLPVNNTKGKFLQESTDMNFVFSAATICVQSTVWRLGALDGVTGRRYVTTVGRIGSPGLGTVSNWFKIERYRNDYKLVFCPMVCKFCKVLCGDVGVFLEDGKRWLGFSTEPLLVMFKKA